MQAPDKPPYCSWHTPLHTVVILCYLLLAVDGIDHTLLYMVLALAETGKVFLPTQPPPPRRVA